ncbi:MAG: hypothetical protein EPO26_04665 [Chloroflexota bacterium]|nr:MAG: hypothetical protein EPO26_04665 [Chloroflexota bacterium]
MPLTIVAPWVLFFGFVNTHQRHARSFEGASPYVELALNISTALGALVGLGLMIFYGTQTAWYWPIVLFAVGSFLGGIVFALLGHWLGALPLSLLSFVGWPASAVWLLTMIRDLQP